MYVEPVVGEAAAVADCGDDRALVVADVHAGIEAAFRIEQGVSVDSKAAERRERLVALADETDPDRLVVLGDLMHSIGGPGGAERGELEVLLESLPDVPVTLVKGNHDGDVESWLDGVEVTATDGVRLGPVGFAHGHTWPSKEVLEAEVVCVGHEHPCVRLEDEVGGSRVERVWLRGPLASEPFRDRHPDLDWRAPELVVFPAFNELSGGTWVNVEGQSFLAPFMPDALPEGDAYLLDGTRLGAYRSL
jgi:putative SbcD/Mre11-related phosphoesterase